MIEKNLPVLMGCPLAYRLTPEVLGKLVALYQHGVFTQGVIRNINSFDQLELRTGQGSSSRRIIPELESQAEPVLDRDSAINKLIHRYWTGEDVVRWQF